MKKINMAIMAVLATAALSSCVREKSFNDLTPLGENAIAFAVQGGATRSGNGEAFIHHGATIPFASNVEGFNLILDETVVNLDEFAPMTKGTPAYTENVGVLYANQLAVHAVGFVAGAEADAVFNNLDQQKVGNGWRYNHVYSSSPWPESGAVDFYLSMPATMNGVSITGYGKADNQGTITFTYQSPSNASEQQDILFAYTSLTKDQHDGYLPNGAPVLFRHALTGVKFAIANHSTTEKISIKEVIFSGLKDSGTCTITPAKNDAQDFGQKKDVTNYYSSATAVNWGTPERAIENTIEVENEDGSTTTVNEFYSYPSGEYADTVFFEPGSSFADNGAYPTSFSAAGNKHNLNDANATQTFWFIPQAMTDDVKLTIKYTFGTDEVKEGVLDFGNELAGVTWNAGELRTYTIRVDDVNVKIEDTVVPTATPNTTLTDMQGHIIYKDEAHTTPYTFTAYGGTKSAVAITNTGNTDAYIRAALIGQWLDNDGNPVFGFTDYTAGKVVLVDSWYQDQFVSQNGKHGHFVNLAGYKNTAQNTEYNNPLGNWYLNSDGYYYYKDAVAPGKIIGTAPTGATNTSDYLGNPLFTSYTVDKNPAVVVAGEVKDVYFVLEVATQGVTAKNSDGSSRSLSEAWSKAGVSVTFPSNN